MTKEERAENWFKNVPDAETISMDKKNEICDKVSRRMMLVFFILFAAECAALFLINDGAIFTWLANLINRLAEGSHTKNHYLGLAIVGSVLTLPLIALPLIVPLVLKNRWVRSEALKAIKKAKAS